MQQPVRFGAVSIELPIAQAGMGGGLAGAELAAAVSSAGGLGTIGILGPRALAREIAEAKRRTARPVAVNLLLPFVHRAHVEAAKDADVLVTFWGRPRRLSAQTWVHQCGSIDEARAAIDAGADAVVVQGVEAGGHVRGETPAGDLLASARRVLPPRTVVLLAGGIADADDVRRAIDAGADGAVLGTRFLLSEESGAHPLYRDRVRRSDRTLLTTLFGFGWPGKHRVVANAATDRWAPPPAWLRALHRASAPLGRVTPLDAGDAATKLQSPRSPIFTPKAPLAGDPDAFVDAAPLYAGETVARIDDVRPAAEIVRALAIRL